ncbi:Sua5/YciO/YrdC/YwlC family protein [Sulfurospirillum arcachonense]|uniref:Sua5/YciO/YrdC/YwlC family protein n=1 Tax=Sulfurospirillum arcachonense TaxID=57666 RepID=UPI00046A80B7|nr:Sua5/YciO/YrdC/YwlC family protein [Sulfurospirillum arcachonense]
MLNPQLVYLVQTETTVGFLSQDAEKLSDSKERDKKQPFIRCVDSLSTLKKFSRVPKKFKNKIRRSQKITFIYPNNQAIRLVKDSEHLKFLKQLQWAYSSSANLTKKNFDESYAKKKADIIVEDKRGFFEGKPSSIIKFNNKKLKKLR